MPRRQGYQNGTIFTVSYCLIFTLFVGGARLWIHRGAYQLDDVVTGLATLVTLGHTVSSYVALAEGLGKPWLNLISQNNIAVLNDVSSVRLRK